MKMFLYSLAVLFLLTSCAGAPAGGGSSSGGSYKSSSKGLTPEQLKKMGVNETKGGY